MTKYTKKLLIFLVICFILFLPITLWASFMHQNNLFSFASNIVSSVLLSISITILQGRNEKYVHEQYQIRIARSCHLLCVRSERGDNFDLHNEIEMIYNEYMIFILAYDRNKTDDTLITALHEWLHDDNTAKLKRKLAHFSTT